MDDTEFSGMMEGEFIGYPQGFVGWFTEIGWVENLLKR
jgi:hypothetical protein